MIQAGNLTALVGSGTVESTASARAMSEANCQATLPTDCHARASRSIWLRAGLQLAGGNRRGIRGAQALPRFPETLTFPAD